MTTPLFLDTALLDAVSSEAAASPRRRKNRNFHPHNDYPAHRLVNAIEPGSYVAPHRHLDPSKDETMVVLRGRLGIVLFADDGSVSSYRELIAGGACFGVDFPHGTWHSVVALAPGTVFLEAKAGPYFPLSEAEQAPWAPAENAPTASAYLQSLVALFER